MNSFYRCEIIQWCAATWWIDVHHVE